MPQIKSLSVPYVAGLSGGNLELVSELLIDSGASGFVEQVNWLREFPYKPITEFNVLRSDLSLFVRFNVRGNLLKAVYSTDQSPVYKDSCVEFFCKLPESACYFNFEFNCIGTCAASNRRARKVDVTPLNEHQMQLIRRLPSIGRRPFNEMQGIFEWNLTVEIPFNLIGIDPDNLPDKLFANFQKCADDTDMPHYVSWSPIHTDKPDFHRPEFFGELLL